MQLLSALQTLELVTVTVIVVRESRNAIGDLVDAAASNVVEQLEAPVVNSR
ncbi:MULTISPECIES: hypothetical protein [unclassified Haloferax]|uniref:hypothetical protein n=1 Tax=unclassified Haloferax TaxID=2625095 RepID=UPI000B0B1F38|nr:MULTISPECIES: hypothetical protein [unclassified Haloferax]